MDNPLAPLRRMAYPGRLILLGKDASGRSVIVLYAVTGRSPSSQARRLVRDGRAVWTRPTDPEVLKTGRPDLLVYPAIMIGRGIAVSNGRQTADIDPDGDGGPVETLERGLKDWSYEPDAPIHTPRISGCVLPSGRAALAVLRRAEGGGILRSFFEIPLDLRLAGATARDTAEAAYAALGPSEEGGRDFRVAVACLFADAADLSQFELHIINREEGKRS